MSRGPQSFEVFAGENVSIPITVRDAAGAVVDLTGASGRFVAARRPESPTRALDSGAASPTATVTFTTPASGLVTVTLDDVHTDGLSGTYWWELKVTDSNTNEVVTSYGYITFKRSQLSG